MLNRPRPPSLPAPPGGGGFGAGASSILILPLSCSFLLLFFHSVFSLFLSLFYWSYFLSDLFIVFVSLFFSPFLLFPLWSIFWGWLSSAPYLTCSRLARRPPTSSLRGPALRLRRRRATTSARKSAPPCWAKRLFAGMHVALALAEGLLAAGHLLPATGPRAGLVEPGSESHEAPRQGASHCPARLRPTGGVSMGDEETAQKTPAGRPGARRPTRLDDALPRSGRPPGAFPANGTETLPAHPRARISRRKSPTVAAKPHLGSRRENRRHAPEGGLGSSWLVEPKNEPSESPAPPERQCAPPRAGGRLRAPESNRAAFGGEGVARPGEGGYCRNSSRARIPADRGLRRLR